MKITEKKFQHFENLIKEELASLLSEQEQEPFKSFFQKYLGDYEFDPKKLSYAEKMKFVLRAYKKTKEGASDLSDHQDALRYLFSESLANRLIDAFNDDSSLKDLDGNWLDDKKAERVFYVLMSNLFYKPKENADLILPDGMPGDVKKIPQIPPKAVRMLVLARRKFAIDMITGRESYSGADGSVSFQRARTLITNQTGLDLDNFEKLFDDAWDIDLKQQGHFASRQFMINLMKLISDENNRIKIIKAQEYGIRWVPAEKKYVKRGVNDQKIAAAKGADDMGQPDAPATDAPAKGTDDMGNNDNDEDRTQTDSTSGTTTATTTPSTLPPTKKSKTASRGATDTARAPTKTKFSLSQFEADDKTRQKAVGELMLQLQKRLSKLGLYKGESDSVFGRGTASALRKAYFVNKQ